jgi:hypothetical protein
MTFRKGNDFPYLVEVDGLYHSEHQDAESAERTFIILCAGAKLGERPEVRKKENHEPAYPVTCCATCFATFPETET